MDSTARKYASRKFLLALLTLIAAGVANALHLPVDPVVADLVKWVLALYFTGNVIAGAVPALAGLFTPRAAP